MRTPVNVERGVELLDERLPGWPNEIDAGQLDLSNGCDCTLGQIFGSYDRGVSILGIGNPSRLGFHLAGRQTFDKLTEAWRRIVLQRQAV